MKNTDRKTKYIKPIQKPTRKPSKKTSISSSSHTTLSMNNIKAASFDHIVDKYERARPGYPNEVYEEIEKHAAFSPDTKILEIGAGHGKATMEMYQRWNPKITAIEPGLSFCKILRKKFMDTYRVSILNTSFEDYITKEKFDCVISATAFHWVNKKTGYRKAAQILKKNGIIALFWNNFSRNDDPIFDEIQEIYRLYYPEEANEQDIIEIQAKLTSERRNELENSGFFRLVSHQEFIHLKTYTAAGYVELLNTFSDNSTKDKESLSVFYKEMENLIRKNGDKLKLPIHVNLEIGEKINK